MGSGRRVGLIGKHEGAGSGAGAGVGAGAGTISCGTFVLGRVKMICSKNKIATSVAFKLIESDIVYCLVDQKNESNEKTNTLESGVTLFSYLAACSDLF